MFGLLAVTRAVFPIMRAQKSGVMVNTSSVDGKMTFRFFNLYHGTKFAVEGITEALTYELSSFGAKAKIVEPGVRARSDCKVLPLTHAKKRPPESWPF